MSTPSSASTAPTEPSAAPPEASDFVRAREMLGFSLRAPLRHKRLGVAIFLLGLVASVAATKLAPRSYEVNAKILAQRNLVISSLGNPRRSVPNDADAPTRSAADVILSYDNLTSIIREADLLGRWERERSPLLRGKDALVGLFSRPLSEEEKLSALVGVMEKRLFVQSDDSSIRISVLWPSPETAYEIVSLAERNFFERRSTVEVAVIGEAIGILNTEAERQRSEIDAALAQVVALRREAVESAAGPRRAAAPPAATPALAPAAPKVVLVPAHNEPALSRADAREAGATAASLDEKRRAIRALDEPRQQKLAQLNARLARLQLTYTDAHPAVVQVQSEIDEAKVESPELVALKREEQALVARLSDMAAPEPARRAAQLVPRPIAAPVTAPAGGTSLVVDVSPRDDEPELASAKAKLLASTRRYEDLLDRVDAARIELTTAQAAFKYRYTVVEPPEVPKEPKGMKSYVLYAAGVVLSGFLCIFAAVVKDLGAGHFVEAWRVRRRLGIPILAEVDQP